MRSVLSVTYQGTKKYTLTGQAFLASDTFNRPADFKDPVTQIKNDAFGEVWAGGGGSRAGGGGAGAAGYSSGSFTPGSSETITVASDVAVDTNGQDGSIGVHIVAKGGKGPSDGTNPGQGGQAAAGTGSTKNSGGNGSVGSGTRGGGGGAGSGGSGGNAVTSTPGTPGAVDGAYSQFPGTVSGWPGGASGSTAGSGQGGRGGANTIFWLAPSLAKAPQVPGLPTKNRSTADATTHSCNAPSDRQVGEMLLLFVVSDGAPATIDVGTWDDGALAQVNQGSSAVSARVFWRIATADANDDAVAISTSASERVSSAMVRVRGATGNPEWTTGQGNGANADPPTHNNTFGSRATLYFTLLGLDSSAAVAITALPSGYGPLLLEPAADTNGATLALTWRQASATSENPGAWAHGAEQYVVGTLAVPGAT